MNSKAERLITEETTPRNADLIVAILPLAAFKSAQQLKLALDKLALDKLDESHQPSLIARQIAQNVQSMRADYATKLGLIHAAIAHEFFKPSNYLKYYFSMLALRAQLALSYVIDIPEQRQLPDCYAAEKTLKDALQAIRSNREKIILC